MMLRKIFPCRTAFPAAALFPLLPVLALLAGCDRANARGVFEDKMNLIVGAVSRDDRGNAPLCEQLLLAPAGGSGGQAAVHVMADYVRVRDDLKQAALATPPPADAATPQPLHTAMVPRDEMGLWLIPYLALGKGNPPRSGELHRLSETHVQLDSEVFFHFDTIEYRRYPDHTAVPLPVAPFGTLAAFQTGLAIVPPRTVPGKIGLRWSFTRLNNKWQLEKISVIEGSIVWVEDKRPL